MDQTQTGSTPDPTPVVRRDEARSRYEITVDGEPVGFSEYQEDGNRTVFLHTVVDERLEGQGLGSTLVHESLADVRARGRRIVPLCPFVAAYLQRHHEFDDLVDRQHKGPSE